MTTATKKKPVAKKNAKQPVKKARTKLKNYKDVQITFLVDGVEAVRKLMIGKEASKITLRRALADLRLRGDHAKSLEAVVNEFAPAGDGHRGRSPAKVGEKRTYRAQKIGDAGPFLRVPLETLNAKKGGLITVSFEKDRIVLTPA